MRSLEATLGSRHVSKRFIRAVRCCLSATHLLIEAKAGVCRMDKNNNYTTPLAPPLPRWPRPPAFQPRPLSELMLHWACLIQRHEKRGPWIRENASDVLTCFWKSFRIPSYPHSWYAPPTFAFNFFSFFFLKLCFEEAPPSQPIRN